MRKAPNGWTGGSGGRSCTRMTKRTKIKVMITVTLLMAVGFAVMFAREIYIPCMILVGVWLFHIIYFAFMVKTHRKEESAEE